MPSSSENEAERWRETVDAVYRSESRRILATLIRLLGDFDLAEEALQDAFTEAMAQWPRTGVPDNPRAWLVSTGRFKAIDQLRRRARPELPLEPLAEELAANPSGEPDLDEAEVEDDRLRLIFTCCHPALSPDSRIALTLREVCDLATEETGDLVLLGDQDRSLWHHNLIAEGQALFDVDFRHSPTTIYWKQLFPPKRFHWYKTNLRRVR
jgi:RNA polymerase sigma-70 factor (ECF subfamily)